MHVQLWGFSFAQVALETANTIASYSKPIGYIKSMWKFNMFQKHSRYGEGMC